MTEKSNLKYQKELSESVCRQEIHLAKMSLEARDLLKAGYSGHAVDGYKWQASMLIQHLENAMRHAVNMDGFG